ncbi:hypothetical protein GCM10010435_37460 [Winogradskya consettensis]|uniref:Uncharacterized protein n=1 Tax=Winogradskya consettensis TaxID=113560 RepID=A0A919T4E4_9ACTN|nr:hypothetical protein [Actinoplanes consettensis]GIM83868.1 hypothetical protein Aco04nite_88640 [Actinoplanes consettensis]
MDVVVNTKRLSAFVGFGTLAVIVVAVAVWQLNPFGDKQTWVPTCSDLSAPMQSAVGGAWAVGKDDPSRKVNDSSTLCELAFTSSDQRFIGTVQVFLSGAGDDDAARREADGYPCDGVQSASAPADGYSVYRSCGRTLGGRHNVSVVAAQDQRWLSLTLSTSIPAGGTPSDVSAFGQDTLSALAHQCVTLSDSK